MSMRIRQKTKKHLYPHWRSKLQSPAYLCKVRDGKRCVDCGVHDRTFAQNAQGEEYFLYLHAAHVHRLDPDPIPPIEGQRLRARCPRCHRLYDIAWHIREEEVEHQRHMHSILRQKYTSGFFLARFTRIQ